MSQANCIARSFSRCKWQVRQRGKINELTLSNHRSVERRTFYGDYLARRRNRSKRQIPTNSLHGINQKEGETKKGKKKNEENPRKNIME